MKFVHVKGVTNKETEIKPDKTKIINNYMREKKVEILFQTEVENTVIKQKIDNFRTI